MDKKRIGFIGVTVLAIVAIIFGFWSPLINVQFISGVTTLLAVLAAYAQYCYDKVDDLFVWWNQLLQKAKNPKADWEQMIDLQFIRDDDASDEEFIDQFTNHFVKTMQKQNYDIKRTDRIGGITTSFEIRNPGRSLGEISLTDVDDETYRITISYSTSYSFNERAKGIDELDEIYQVASRPLTIDESYTNRCVRVKLLFEKGNPFYGYVIRKISPLKVTDFELRFESVDNVAVSATNKYLQLDATHFSQLKNVLNDLIVLPNID